MNSDRPQFCPLHCRHGKSSSLVEDCRRRRPQCGLKLQKLDACEIKFRPKARFCRKLHHEYDEHQADLRLSCLSSAELCCAYCHDHACYLWLCLPRTTDISTKVTMGDIFLIRLRKRFMPPPLLPPSRQQQQHQQHPAAVATAAAAATAAATATGMATASSNDNSNSNNNLDHL